MDIESTPLPQQPHPCQYCSQPCFGKQCKDCHLKMFEERKGECLDCKKFFSALRKDGTKKRRCFECQREYNSKYISICPDCNLSYHAYMDDGRVFEKCFSCYKQSLRKCSRCDNLTKNNFALCRTCYRNPPPSEEVVFPVE